MGGVVGVSARTPEWSSIPLAGLPQGVFISFVMGLPGGACGDMGATASSLDISVGVSRMLCV